MTASPKVPKVPRKSRAKVEQWCTLEELFAHLKTVGAIKSHGCFWGIPGRLHCVEPEAPYQWTDLAYLLSEVFPGQFWVGSNSISWVNGGKPSLYFAPLGRLEGIIEARGICARLTGLPDEKIPCSSAGVARKMLEWVNIRQMTARALDFIGAKDSWQYQHCDPIDLPNAYLWDIQSCYFSLLQRAYSPKVIWLNGRLHWCPISTEEHDRWDKMLLAAAPHKGIRNSFIGLMYAQSDGLFYSDGKSNQNQDKALEYLRASDGVTLYQTGNHLDHRLSPRKIDERQKPEEKQAKPGPLRPLASLIVRTAYELCGIARYEEKAFYANTDCVITTNPHSPDCWKRYGLKVALKGQGPTSIYTVGYYVCGEYETKHVTNAKEKIRQGKRVVWPRRPAHEPEERVKCLLTGPLWADKWLLPET